MNALTNGSHNASDLDAKFKDPDHYDVYGSNGSNSSNDSYDYEYPYWVQSPDEPRYTLSMTIAFITAYSIVLVIGLIGNFLVLSFIIRAPKMRTVPNIFICNLAIADVLVIFVCLPANMMGCIFIRKSNYTSEKP